MHNSRDVESREPEFVCVDECHYIHLGINPKTGKPCNSSVGPACWDPKFDDAWDDDERSGWSCLGCDGYWREMPPLEPLGLEAIAHLR